MKRVLLATGTAINDTKAPPRGPSRSGALSCDSRRINGTPGGWVNVSPRGAHKAHDSLRTVLGYVEVHMVRAACVDLPFTRDLVGTDGLVADETVRAGLREVLIALRDHVRARRPG